MNERFLLVLPTPSFKIACNVPLREGGRRHPAKAGLEKLLKNQFNQGGKIDKEIT